MAKEQTNFDKLYGLNVNDKVEKKDNGYVELSYLSWSHAWAEFVKVYPSATYEIMKNANGLPYFADINGAMVYTKVTVEPVAGETLTHEMWLPVMDGNNKAMKQEPYKYKTKNGEKWVQAYTMFDVNKTVMRCLVKNLAMFGLGLYIYAGEDLPEVQSDEVALPVMKDATPEDIKAAMTAFKELCEAQEVDPAEFLASLGVDTSDTNEKYKAARKWLKSIDLLNDQLLTYKQS